MQTPKGYDSVNLFLETERQALHEEEQQREKPNWLIVVLRALGFVVAAVALVGVLTVSLIAIITSRNYFANNAQDLVCSKQCTYEITESIPNEMKLPFLSQTNSTFSTWNDLITNAKKSIKIASFYFSLTNKAVEQAQGNFGNTIWNELIAASKRGIQVTIVRSDPGSSPSEDDLSILQAAGATVYTLDWKKAFGGGILHTKMIIVDDDSFYVGSANTDWRSLSQVKELGVTIKNCDCLAKDIAKIFTNYQYVANTLQSNFDSFNGWPQEASTMINMKQPLNMTFTNTEQSGNVYISSSPAAINAPGRTNDLVAMLNLINTAKSHVSLSVMDYMSMRIYEKPTTWWPELDTAIRNAMFRNVNVKLLVSYWNHTDVGQFILLNNLYTFRNFCNLASHKKPFCNATMELKIMHIPDPVDFVAYPYTRVNHAKYMVSESEAWISTSNWSYDYFYQTGGISFVATHADFVGTVQSVFDRDFNSEYAQDLSVYLKKFNLN